MSAVLSENTFFKKRKLAESELKAAEKGKAEEEQRSGIDLDLALAVAWSIIGTFIILGSTPIYMMEVILMPITLAIVVGMVLGLAADRLAKFGPPPALGGLILAGVFVIGRFFWSTRWSSR